MSRRKAEQILRSCFGATGLVRPPSGERKGWEVRLVLFSPGEVELVREALDRVGLRAGAPWAKAKRTVIPLYGEAAMLWFTNPPVITPSSKSPH